MDKAQTANAYDTYTIKIGNILFYTRNMSIQAGVTRDRLALCFNACAGMSDKELQDAIKSKGILNLLKCSILGLDTLKSQLDEAVELLEEQIT